MSKAKHNAGSQPRRTRNIDSVRAAGEEYTRHLGKAANRTFGPGSKSAKVADDVWKGGIAVAGDVAMVGLDEKATLPPPGKGTQEGERRPRRQTG